jgi:hypothetical protein
VNTTQHESTKKSKVSHFSPTRNNQTKADLSKEKNAKQKRKRTKKKE